MEIVVSADERAGRCDQQPHRLVENLIRNAILPSGQSVIGVMRNMGLITSSDDELGPLETARQLRFCTVYFEPEKVIPGDSGKPLVEGADVVMTNIEDVPENNWPTKDGSYDISGVILFYNSNANRLEIEFTQYTKFHDCRQDILNPGSAKELLAPTPRPKSEPALV